MGDSGGKRMWDFDEFDDPDDFESPDNFDEQDLYDMENELQLEEDMLLAEEYEMWLLNQLGHEEYMRRKRLEEEQFKAKQKEGCLIGGVVISCVFLFILIILSM